MRRLTVPIAVGVRRQLAPDRSRPADRGHWSGRRSAKRAPGTVAEAAPTLLALAWSSVAALAIAPLQDVLNLGKEARMNQPGSPHGNWRWRVTADQLSGSALESLHELTRASARTESAMAATV